MKSKDVYKRQEDDSEVKNNDDSALNTLAGDKAKEYKYDENSHQYIRYVNGCLLYTSISLYFA